MIGDIPVNKDHFRSDLDEEASRDLFKQSVSWINLETFSHCNRQCWFCANSYIDRLSGNQELDSKILDMVVKNLASINYSGVINLSLYNEPLFDESIIGPIKTIRDHCPNAQITVFSNGDFLNEDYLTRLSDAGLNKIHLSIHTGNNEDLNDQKVQARIRFYREKIGLKINMSIESPGEQYKGTTKFGNIDIQLYEPNMRVMGSNMGELIAEVEQHENRTNPCFDPAAQFTIEYGGKVVPCCRIRTDAKEHADMHFCSLHDVDSIFQAYTHPRAVEWRRSVSFYGDKQSPCSTCDNAVFEGNWIEKKVLNRLKESIA